MVVVFDVGGGGGFGVLVDGRGEVVEDSQPTCYCGRACRSGRGERWQCVDDVLSEGLSVAADISNENAHMIADLDAG